VGDMSDHNGVITLLDFETELENEIIEIKRTNFEFVNSELYSIHDNLSKFTNPNELYDYILKKLNDALQQGTTVNYKKKRKNEDCPWMTENLKKLIKEKDNFWRKNKKKKNDAEFQLKYKQMCKKLTTEKNRNKRKYYFQRFKNAKSSRETWKFLNEVMGKSKKKKERTSKILYNGSIITDDDFSKSNAFNNYFVDSTRLLALQFPRKNNAEYLQNITNCPISMALFAATENEIFNLIIGLQDGKSSGYDKISVNTVKQCAPTLTYAITVLFNLSLETGIYPSKLKIAKVIPIHKSGSKENIANYRPISLLPVLNNFFDKLLFCRLWNFLMTTNFFYSHQYGFQPKIDTATALIEFMSEVYTAIEAKNFAAGIFLDLSKAFDTVNHTFLLDKFEKAGIRGMTSKLIKSYLTGRKQFVSLKGVDGDQLSVEIGVPQGYLGLYCI
jgi:Reverse transcriptase (RNA-dependent DNA polymerase)